MTEHKLEFFDWFDIQKEICKEMGIEDQYFRDYHKLVVNIKTYGIFGWNTFNQT